MSVITQYRYDFKNISFRFQQLFINLSCFIRLLKSKIYMIIGRSYVDNTILSQTYVPLKGVGNLLVFENFIII